MNNLQDPEFIQYIIENQSAKGHSLEQIKKGYLKAGGLEESWEKTMLLQKKPKLEHQHRRKPNNFFNSIIKLSLLVVFFGFVWGGYMLVTAEKRAIKKTVETFARYGAEDLTIYEDVLIEHADQMLDLFKTGSKTDLDNIPVFDKTIILLLRHQTPLSERSNVTKKEVIDSFLGFNVEGERSAVADFVFEYVKLGNVRINGKEASVDFIYKESIIDIPLQSIELIKEGGKWKIKSYEQMELVRSAYAALVEIGKKQMSEDAFIFTIIKEYSGRPVSKSTIWRTIE